ncbi:hypothetical protein BSP109_01392 [Brevibacterium sp. Mu109]|uniref:peptidoglycan-binding protein n=1 Tax=Brevibacterium sp. Mu109 TaxID=1255669 RepID=UPI000C4A18E2|nr:peptidoglycan-binding protein [Brevibacterium sp. Mu109]SMX77719.1 hypothetical protein BSP109_01392 [Brevibacterium sp. Mu109]
MSTQSTRPVTRTGLIAATVLSAGALAAAPLLLPSSAQAAPSAEPTTAASQTSGSALTPFNATDTERIEAYTTVAQLSPEQVENARTIIAVGRGADIPDQGIVIALMTAMQESSMLNLDYGDRDSLGLFQQRPAMAWGTPEDIMDPVYSSKSFYGVNPEGPNPGLLQIDGWESMAPGDAAQAVQRSAYPDLYAQWEELARDLLSQNGDVAPIA